MHVELSRVSVRYRGQERPAVDEVSLGLTEGSIGVLIGPSGCGKTTLLRAVAGLERASAGEVRLSGEVVESPQVHLAPEARRIGMVFQDYALFPHLDVGRNVGFGLGSLPRVERAPRVAEVLALVGLAGIERRMPHELSGGQQQRVALARALAPRPQLLLLDEPFSNLDVELRERLSIEVRAILKSLGATALMVTHDQHEAFAMADYVGVMNDGGVEQWDTPYSLYHRPASRFVADFVGEGVLLPARASADDGIHTVLGSLRHCPGCGLKEGQDVALLLRPDDVLHDDESTLKAEVVKKAFRGAEFLYTLRLEDGNQVLSLVPSHHNHAIGEKIGIKLDVDHVVAFPRGSDSNSRAGSKT